MMNVLVLNAGSSTLKFQLIATDLERIKDNQDQRLCRGAIERIGGEAVVTVQNGRQERTSTATLTNVRAAVLHIIRSLTSDAEIHAVGHRVVHGGELFSESVVITGAVMKDIQDCIDLAPLHNPNNIAGILAAREALGEKAPQVAVFDEDSGEAERCFRKEAERYSGMNPNTLGAQRRWHFDFARSVRLRQVKPIRSAAQEQRR